MAIKNVVLIGAGGNIGTYILSALDKAGFSTTVLTRKSSKSTFPSHKAISISDDYPYAELVAAFKGQDAVITTVTPHPDGNLKLNLQDSLIDAAIEAGVQRFIPNEFGGDNRNAASVELVPLFAEKLKTIEYLKARAGKIEYTAIPTGPFYDFGLKIGFIGADPKNGKATITEGGNQKFSTTTEAQVGELVAAVLKHEKETANKHVAFESFLVSQNDILAAVEKEGKKLTVEHQSGQALIEGSKAGYATGNIYALYGLVQAAVFLPGYGSDFSAEAEGWRKLFGIKKLDLQEETKRVLAEIDAQG